MTSKAILSESEMNRISIEYFTNPSYYGEIGSACKEDESERKRDVKFYRRRIVALTKDIFRGADVDASLRSAFDDYVSSAIAHLKMLDTKDILQDEYSELQAPETHHAMPGELDAEVGEANSQLMKIPQVGGTLDSFVVSTRPANQQEDPPKLKTVNLQDPKLKHKGVKRKKKR